jgi:hypothetical protein
VISISKEYWKKHLSMKPKKYKKSFQEKNIKPPASNLK